MHPLRFFLYFTIVFGTVSLPLHSIEKEPTKTDSLKTSIQSKISEIAVVFKKKCEIYTQKVKNYVSPYEKDFKKANKWLNIIFGATFYPVIKLVTIAHECGHASAAKLAGYELKEFYISPNPDGAGYVVTTTPQRSRAKLYELLAGPLAGFTASFVWLKIWNMIQAYTGPRNLSLLQAIQEPLFGAHTSTLAFRLAFGLALGQLYGNLVPQDIECEDHYGDAFKGQTLHNDGKQIEKTLKHIAPRLGKYYSYFAYALCGAFLCYMVHTEYTIVAAKKSALTIAN